MTRWAIEDSFPIVEINRLAVPERNAFKPIYQMHKWFARRASCVFRAILLGCLKPLPVDKDGKPTKSGAEVIMEEFYRDHTHDPDTNGKVILDPFMGGGTTVVEGLRLGCKVIGVDLNPVAWFIVKCETTPVDIKELERAFDDLAKRIVPWSGKPLKQTLLDLYKTTCPCCGNADADIIYAFWVKSAICTDPTCGKQVPLFGDYFVAAKQPSIRYYQDVSCPKCHKSFDWEIEPASLIAEQSLTVVSDTDGAGVGRGNKRWAFATEEPVVCPWCGETVRPKLGAAKIKPARKKVPLSVLLCPDCQAVWQYRGSVPEQVACPTCEHVCEPTKGNHSGGSFVCVHCGKRDTVLNSVRSLQPNQPLPMSMYAIHGFCAACRKNDGTDDDDIHALFEPDRCPEDHGKREAIVAAPIAVDHRCFLAKSGGKFFKRIEPTDLELYGAASQVWARHCDHLPHPTNDVPSGQKTKTHLLGHNYPRWKELFNNRQLLALGTLAWAVSQSRDNAARALLTLQVSATTDTNNIFTRYMPLRNSQGGQTAQGIFARHDFHPKVTACEQNVWGLSEGGIGSFVRRYWLILDGLRYQKDGWEVRYHTDDQGRRRRLTVGTESLAKTQLVTTAELLANTMRQAALLLCDDARNLDWIPSGSIDMVVTDPPYAGNIDYSELSDFYYSWLRAIENGEGAFAPDQTPKAAEIVENPARGKSAEEFETGLTQAFDSAGAALKQTGLLVFTFHHSENRTWERLLSALCRAGYVIEAVYPVQSETETSLHLMEMAGAVSYDLIHVCRSGIRHSVGIARSWAGVRQEIRRRARQEIETIEGGRYGNEPLSPADVNIILIGKCLELYSRHYGHVLDHAGRNVPLHEALEAIRMEVDMLISREQPLPSELADIDPVSYVYLVCLADKAFEIKGDELHKYTRGVIEPDELLKAGLIKKGRIGRGRHFEIKSPAERFTEIQERLDQAGDSAQSALPGMEEAAAASDQLPFIDYVHFLIALVEGGENLRPWMERFRGKTPQIRAACVYLRNKQPRFADACGKILKFIDVTPLFG